MMQARSLSIPNPEDRRDDPADEYRALSGLAVVGLLLALASPLAFFSIALWLIPLAGVAVSAWALVRINADDSGLVGRKAAVAGLVISALVLAAAPADWFVYRWMLQREARQYAEIWLRLLRDNEPHKAHQLAVNPAERLPLDTHLWNAYEEASRREELEAYVKEPAVHSLLDLGPKAQVRFYQIGTIDSREGVDSVQLYYAVTFPEGDAKKSYFVRLQLGRVPLDKPRRSDWYVGSCEAGVLPPGFPAPAGTPPA
jgi:hypothetical protein